MSDKLYIITTDKKNQSRLFFWRVGILLFLGMFFLVDNGNSSSKSDIPKSLIPHTAINLNGGAETESNLAITSNGYASGISVTNGGVLTLNNSTIIKTAPTGSSSEASKDDAYLEPYANEGPDPNKAPGAMAGIDPNVTQGPPGTPGGPPPDDSGRGIAGSAGSKSGGRTGGGTDTAIISSDIGSKSAGAYAGTKGKAILSNITIDTNLAEGKGICAIGEGSSVILLKCAITTTGRSSHGVFVTGGGAASLKDVSIITKGEHSSTLATDTGGGTIIVEGGAYITSGKYSAGIYSTGDIRASNATFKAEVDNAAVMEYGSKITLNNTSLWSGKKGAVMIFQSVPNAGNISEYKMTGGEVKSAGPIFYVTNTEATINLKGVKLSSESGIVLKALKGYWGSDVASAKPIRGGTVTFTADEQTLQGDIVMDENSSITATLKNKSKLKGAINADKKGKKMNFILDPSSTWDVTADSCLDILTLSEVSGDSIPNIIGNGHTVYYDKTLSTALGGKTYNLTKGGKLQPK
jgi:hypothetical protein